MHPVVTKVGKVNGRLIRKLGSLHDNLPTHYSSLIGGIFVKVSTKGPGPLAVHRADSHINRNAAKVIERNDVFSVFA